jgi:Flp pilus assembly protein TadG
MVTGRIMRNLAARAGGLLRRLRGDCSGVAAVEFALLLPVMLGLYIGGLEISDGFTIKRKVTNTTSALGDLITRTEDITTAEMTDILKAASAVMAPYDISKLKIKLSGVTIDEDEKAEVTWGAKQNDTCPIKGTSVTLPEGVTIADSFLIMVEVHYDFDPAIGYVFTGPIDITDTFYLKPRLTGTIAYDNACT